MAYKFLDSVGLSYTFQKIKALLNGKADSNHTHKYAGSASVGGAANSATKLETARTINGVAFDGTENINIDVGVKSINGSTGAVTLKDYVTGLSVSGKTVTYTKKDGTSGTITTQDTTYSEATTSANGLMSKADKSKLDGIASGANAYTHPNSGVTAGTYKSVTVNAQGHVTGGSNPTTLAGYGITDAKIASGKITLGSNSITPLTAESSLNATKITGTISIDNLPAGALERCVVVADDTARKALTTTDVQKGDTVKVTSTGLMYFVKDDTKLSSDDGYEVYTAGSASAVPWSGVTGKPSTFTPPTATSSVLGGVKVGSNITVSSGTISLTKANVTAALGYTPPTTNTTYSVATTSANGLMASTDKTNLNAAIKGLSVSGKTITYTKVDGTTGTITTQDTNTTYSAATTSANGLMSSTDKAKLDAITASADSVSFSRSLTSGTKIGTITINGTGTDIYCESGVEVEALTTEELDEILV